MGIFARLGTLIKSNLNDMISKSEDPEKMLNQVLTDMKTQLVEARKQVVTAISDEKRLRKQLDDEQGRVHTWEDRAVKAVQAGDDELARQALDRQKEHEELAAQLEKQWQLQAAAVAKLKEQLAGLTAKIEEAGRKRNILIARAKRAEAQRTIQQTMAGLSDTSAFDTFERMSEKVDRLEAHAEAETEFAGELRGDALEARWKALESSSASSDDRLRALKARVQGEGRLLGSGSDGKALPESGKSQVPTDGSPDKA